MELIVDQTLKKGVEAHKKGDLQEAERCYREILEYQPTHPNATHNLGLIAIAMNMTKSAIPLFKTALKYFQRGFSLF